jgi:hypothetical protein
VSPPPAVEPADEHFTTVRVFDDADDGALSGNGKDGMTVAITATASKFADANRTGLVLLSAHARARLRLGHTPQPATIAALIPRIRALGFVAAGFHLFDVPTVAVRTAFLDPHGIRGWPSAVVV